MAEKEYERFVCWRLEGRPKSVYLKLSLGQGQTGTFWVPRSLCNVVKKPAKPGGEWIVDIESWWVKKEEIYG